MSDFFGMSIQQFLSVVGVAGVTSALFSFIFRWIEDWRINKRHAHLLAIKVSISIDEFFQECAEWIGDIELEHDSNGIAGKWHRHLPSPPVIYSDDTAWLYFDQQLADRVFRLHPNVRYSNGKIDFISDFVGEEPEDIRKEVLDMLYETAIDCYKLVKDTRVRYSFPAIPNSEDIFVRLAETQRD